MKTGEVKFDHEAAKKVIMDYKFKQKQKKEKEARDDGNDKEQNKKRDYKGEAIAGK